MVSSLPSWSTERSARLSPGATPLRAGAPPRMCPRGALAVVEQLASKARTVRRYEGQRACRAREEYNVVGINGLG